MPRKRVSKGKRKATEEVEVDVSSLTPLFSTGENFENVRRASFGERKALLSKRGKMDFELYLLTIGIDLNKPEEVNHFLLFITISIIIILLRK